MNLGLLAEEIVKSIVKNKDDISIRETTLEDETILIQILVNEEDFGRVIGRDGKIANAIRTLIQASGYIHNVTKIRVNIDKI